MLLVNAEHGAGPSSWTLRPWLPWILIGLLAVVPARDQDERPEDNWPTWRGPLGTGAAPYADPPVEWDEDTNVRWKTALPGLGHSSPVVWGDRIFLTTAIPVGRALPPRHSKSPGAHDNLPVTHKQQFVVLAVDRRDGSIAWQRPVHEELPHEGWHHTASAASDLARDRWAARDRVLRVVRTCEWQSLADCAAGRAMVC